MQENRQWQAFVETGDIHHYLRYKEAQALAMVNESPQKELSDGRNCDTGTSIARSEI